MCWVVNSTVVLANRRDADRSVSYVYPWAVFAVKEPRSAVWNIVRGDGRRAAILVRLFKQVDIMRQAIEASKRRAAVGQNAVFERVPAYPTAFELVVVGSQVCA